jgi:hypothetical protein
MVVKRPWRFPIVGFADLSIQPRRLAVNLASSICCRTFVFFVCLCLFGFFLLFSPPLLLYSKYQE